MASKYKKQGKLFIFEGIDGVGKTTIAKEISKYLNDRQEACELMAFPGKEPGTIGKLVYELHHDPSKYGIEILAPISRQALHIVAHLDVIERSIIPTLKTGRHVILDRCWWSTWVYGLVSGIERRVLESMINLEQKQWNNIKPALVILLRCNAPFNTNDNLENWQKLRNEYDLLATREQGHYPVFTLNNTGSLEDAIERVKKILEQRLSASSKKDHEKFTVEGQLNLDLGEYGDYKNLTPELISHISPAKPTIVFDSYWRLAAERQNIFFKRLKGMPFPWTNDPILSQYKFTNAYRASDRTSQYLIRHVIYRDDLPSSSDEVFFRLMLFKLFNKIETWQLIESKIGNIVFSEYSFERYDQILTEAMSKGQSIYSAAYIMPSGGKILGHTTKHRNHLKLLERMMADELPKKLQDAPSMQRGFDLLRGYPTIGDFLAYQFITDVNYSEITDWSEMEFVVPGPGALDGICKCFRDLGGLNEPELIKFMAESQEQEFERLGLNFQSLWGRKLQLIDCQNLFCEVDKYARVKHPDISGKSGRTRIKQKYSLTKSPINYWYPPKWGINQAIE